MKKKLLILATGLLLCASVAAMAVLLETRYTVTIRNATSQTLENVRVFGGGCDESVGDIPAGEETIVRFWIQRDGELRLQARNGVNILDETIDGYVTHNWGGDIIVDIQADGTLSVIDSREVSDSK